MSCQRAALCAYSSIFRERQRSILVRLKDTLTARNEPLQRYVVGVDQQEVVMGFVGVRFCGYSEFRYRLSF